MALAPRGHEYPRQDVQVVPFPTDLSTLFPQPAGLIQDWPPTQLTYLGVYLTHLGCKTVVVESHYVDRDYIQDMALFYSLSLRSYPNHCQRLHFFRGSFDQARFRDLVLQREDPGRAEAAAFLQGSYLGFSVVRPLPGTPVGRTVLPPFGSRGDGHERKFPGIRDYQVHLGSFDLRVTGLAFQQQDQGVSACATTALWSAFHRTAHLEGLPVPPPASITEAGSRYFVGGGRALPSEGLNIYQICEAIRAAGLAPLVIPGISPDSDRAQILGYLGSGFAPVLAILPLNGSDSGHAVCGVGIKLGPVLPQSNPAYHFRDQASAVLGIYVNDDRLGPYASVDLYPYTTDKGVVRTGLRISWPGDQVEAEHSILHALIVPVPTKLRLTVARMRVLGQLLAEVTGQLFPSWSGLVTMNCRYCLGTTYRQAAPPFGLSDEGLFDLSCLAVLSRHVGVVEISAPDGPLFDVLLDATETSLNPGALICVRRNLLTGDAAHKIAFVARKLGARFIS